MKDWDEKMNIREVVCKIIMKATVLGEGVYQLQGTENILDLGIDSFQLMNVIVELENELNIEFRDEDLIIIKFQNLNEICNSIQEVLTKYAI